MKRIKIRWSKNLAYAVGLIATDGNLSKDGRHIDLTSKDLEQIENFKAILKLRNKIGLKSRSKEKVKKYFRIQFGDVTFYKFLLQIGLTPNKSKTIGQLRIPEKYFADFLRGSLDGDGSISYVKHSESQYLQLRLKFCSASLEHLIWVYKQIKLNFPEINGGFIYSTKKNMNHLIFAKSDANKLLARIYHDKVKYCLSRKFIYWSNFRASGEMVYTLLLGSSAARHGGSSPLSPTKKT